MTRDELNEVLHTNLHHNGELVQVREKVWNALRATEAISLPFDITIDGDYTLGNNKKMLLLVLGQLCLTAPNIFYDRMKMSTNIVVAEV